MTVMLVMPFLAMMRFDRDVYEVLDDCDGYYVDDVRGIF
jgi:hypothetical protein